MSETKLKNIVQIRPAQNYFLFSTILLQATYGKDDEEVMYYEKTNRTIEKVNTI